MRIKFNKTPFNRLVTKEDKEVRPSNQITFNKSRFNINNVHSFIGEKVKGNQVMFNRSGFNTRAIPVSVEKEVKEIAISYGINIGVNVIVSSIRDPIKGRYIKVLDNDANNELGRVTNIINPLIYEEINTSYEFSFTTIIDESVKLIKMPNIIEVDNDFFRVSKIVKVRDSSITVNVDCEHISYQLIDEDDENTFYETEAHEMLASILDGTQFKVGIVEFTPDDIRYYEPSDTSKRKRIIEVAELFGGELIYDKFTISLVKERKESEEVHDLKLGENIKGVTQETDFTVEPPRKAYEIDVLDLAHMPEYSYLNKISLGNYVNVYDPQLKLNEVLRIISYERDPFQMINPSVQIGNIIRDYTDYGKGGNSSNREDSGYYIETKTSHITGMTIFSFDKRYSEFVSVTTGLIGNVANNDITVVVDPFKIEGKYAGAYVMVYGSTKGLEAISLQAICKM